jgi:ornithine carbamoyltransferase
MRHVLSMLQLGVKPSQEILTLAHWLKKNWQSGDRTPWLAGRSLALLFEKPSLRTRLSFEAGMIQLGGNAIYLSQDVGWQTRESVSDFIRVLAEYCDALVCRTFDHQTVMELASYDVMPIVNGLTDRSHPCQALSDIFTMQEVLGQDLRGRQVTFIGDANNVCRSLAVAACGAGMRFRVLGAPNYFLGAAWIEELKSHLPQADLVQTEDPREALREADFVYTDVWTSMGQEAETQVRRQAFSPLQVNRKLMQLAPSSARVLHCLPARRGEEITDEVIDSSASLVIAQAGNRMHLQKGLLLWIGRQMGWLAHPLPASASC